ncbi:hypothetical protein GSI_04110 [Ganoderma sinense ZZ0214-1]|uniref:Uncharacterized protein n=1 Tax=Ganoderma sinense ZZ0214-1 TaxID=1077348 RepID=A0A2G8SIE3_9APHY|nr:hypothetical protein GSI_04110 [Ganoderma sinense ZZ0214-1]
MSAVVPRADVTPGPIIFVPVDPTQDKKRKNATLTEDQLTQEGRDALAAALEAVCDFASEKAERLVETYGYEKEYYLRLIFSGGASKMSERRSNPYNAWVHDLAKRYSQGPHTTEVVNLFHLQREHRHEYDALTEQQKHKLVTAYDEDRQLRKLLSPRFEQGDREQDIRQSFKAMQDMFLSLKLRAGCDGFICLVKSDDDLSFPSMWYFTNPEIDRYLSSSITRWDIGRIGELTEKFCMEAGNIMRHLTTNRERAIWFKKEISEKLNSKLAEITGNPKAAMAYKDYDGKVALGHGVILEGWTHEIFAAPSALPMTLEPLRILFDALNSGHCHFRRLTGPELTARQVAYGEKLKNGMVTIRKERSDKGTKRKFYRSDIYTANDDQEEGPSQKRACLEDHPSGFPPDSSSDSSSNSDSSDEW